MSRVNVTWATPAHAEAMAQAHAGAFTPGWREDEFEDLLDGEGVFGFLARDEDGPLGVILCRIAAGEMEVLTIGVPAAARRRGVARALMAAALTAARTAGTEACFLEVAVDNAAATALYEGLGFHHAGLRKAYYDRGADGVMDAIVMRLDLNAASA
jgi:ribosomal-protein-alanine N-acetyltransferase